MTTKWGFQEAGTRKDINNIAGGRSGGFNAKFMRFPTPLCFCHPDVRGPWALLHEEAAGEVCGLYLSKSAGQCLPSCQTNLKAMAIEKGL